MANAKRKRSGVIAAIIGTLIAVGGGMLVTGGGDSTPTQKLLFVGGVAIIAAGLFRSVAAVAGAVVTSLALCFLVAPNIPGLTG
jgi:hypothetical protein